MRKLVLSAALALGLLPSVAFGQVKVGVTLSASGPAATFGATERTVMELAPREIGGESVEYIVLDDASDPAVALRNARRLIDEETVDVIIGSSTSPNSLAILETVAQSKTPMIAMGSAAAIVTPMDDNRRWAFKSVHNDATMMKAVFDKMLTMDVKRLGYIGLADASADGWLEALRELTKGTGVELVAVEKYNRTDRSVVAQALRLISAQPDAIFVSASSTPAATAFIDLRQRGWDGPMFSSHGVAANEVMDLAGDTAIGLMIPIGPLMIADQLDDDDPVKTVALDIIARYEEKAGVGTHNTFISNGYDPLLMLQSAIPVALESGAKPGTPEFRAALRDALEGLTEMVGTQGIYTMTPDDHVGLDERSAHIVVREDDGWRIMD